MTTGGILALDLASSIGWADASPAALCDWPGTLMEAHARPAPPFEVGTKIVPGTVEQLERFADAYHEWLHEMIVSRWPAFVVRESCFVGPHTDQNAAQKLFGLAWHTDWMCRRLGVECRQVEAKVWRLHFTGVGTGKRVAMKANAKAACDARGWPYRNEDEADVSGIIDYAAMCLWRARRVAA